MCNAGQAWMAYFYFDFRDVNWHDLVPSLLIQLSTQSGPCCDINALDDCPDTSEVPSPWSWILWLLKELVDLQIPDLS